MTDIYVPLPSASKAVGGETPLVVFNEDDDYNNGRKWNPNVVSFIREDWIAAQMKERESQFTEHAPVRVFVGTWNVGAKSLSESIASWLRDNMGSASDLPELYVVGLQEIVDLNAGNVIVANQGNRKAQQWSQDLLAALNTSLQMDPSERFVMMDSKNLVGILLCVFVKKKHVPALSEIQGSTAGVGVLGMMGNKGAAAIRFRFYDSTLCFVCSHLAAHQNNVAGRNSDFGNIMGKVEFRNTGVSESVATARPGSSDHSASYGIMEHDYVFWLGDLNYRIDLPLEETMMRAKSGSLDDLNHLLAFDQLNQERAAGRVFVGFHEGSIRFPPTYKYQAGTDRYDERPEKTIRAPAWCDRVLWHVSDPANEEHLRLLYYGRTEQKVSDHKPVHSLFEVSVKRTMEDKRELVSREVMRRLDEMENRTLPRLSLSNPIITFGNAYYRMPKSDRLTIKNIGAVPAHFRFVPKLEDRVFCRPWLTISPSFGMVLPGEAIDITFELLVTAATARDISMGRESLNDVLVLRLEKGQDFFVPISANPIPSAFGASIAQLAARSEPMRTVAVIEDGLGLPHESESTATAPSGPSTQSVAVLPKEIWRLVDFIYTRGIDTPGLFVAPGDEVEMAAIREYVDSGTDIDPSTNCLAVAQVLLELLASFREPVIPSSSFPDAEFTLAGVTKWSFNMLRSLSALHYNCLLFIIAFVKEALTHSASNLLTEATAARAFSSVLMRKRPHEDAAMYQLGVHTLTGMPAPSEQEQEAMDAIILHFISSTKLE